MLYPPRGFLPHTDTRISCHFLVSFSGLDVHFKQCQSHFFQLYTVCDAVVPSLLVLPPFPLSWLASFFSYIPCAAQPKFHEIRNEILASAVPRSNTWPTLLAYVRSAPGTSFFKTRVRTDLTPASSTVFGFRKRASEKMDNSGGGRVATVGSPRLAGGPQQPTWAGLASPWSNTMLNDTLDSGMMQVFDFENEELVSGLLRSKLKSFGRNRSE